ncbi:hypothetical protein HOV23_gp057 [Pseudomonas phage Lana]|uniref:Uncharacterized protein n=1 Tax=Pseudomonas phage Lana TaxID=2530172 RepID=A0A481W604_9CAUD|nr:hypothetical protein HOV23_gp057 [Pseudomonas phage Lana]QBJ04516.1 hypothetical protein [Pseudomonas phage Lana]
MTEKKITTDFAAIEQRVLEHYEKHGDLPLQPTSALLDIHTITTAITLGLMYSEVTRPQRSNVGKTLNFAMLYTPGAMWEVPQESVLMAIWTDEERVQLCRKLGVTQTVNLYKVLTHHFNTAYKGQQ